ncbi:MAG TPA: hypothetical protein VG126_15175 [Thermoleophilaceae bacterium]|nr:hypothetical protein [Thermoleophilaceae bacterium]
MPEHDAETLADTAAAVEGNGGDPLDMNGDGADPTALAPAVTAAPAAPVAAPAVPVSGLYLRDPQPANVLEELRIDVDGRYPQMVASGTVYRPLRARMHWAAEVKQIGPNRWRGPIFFEHSPGVRFPWEQVTVQLTRGATPEQHRAKLTMHRPGGDPRVRKFAFSQESMRSRPVSLELDWEQGVTPVLEVDTCEHPDRPSGLTCETVTIEKIYERAGFDVRLSPGGPVPIQASGVKASWSDFELHDAMEVYWSRFAPRAQWAVWAFYAGLHDDLPPEHPGGPPIPGEYLLGIMFDTFLGHAGPEERQGCALFDDAIAANTPPPGTPNHPAWRRRETFFTAVHEIGHAFNLAHSFDKSIFDLGWIPLEDEYEARSFMNYPFLVQGGPRAFFKRFRYRFSSQELTFLRHAHPAFVKPGERPFFFDHGLVDPELQTGLKLRLRANRERAVFEFMEPVALELKLTNASLDPKLVDRQALAFGDSMAVFVQRERGPVRQVRPYSRRCMRPNKTVIEPEVSMYAPLRMFAGVEGWEIAEPGTYTVQVVVLVDGEEVVSNPMRLRVEPPRDSEQERIAGEYFSDEVGRILAFNGSGVLDGGNDILREVTERLDDSRAALHARLALGNVAARDTKRLEPDEGAGEARMHVEIDKARPEEGQALLQEALIAQPEEAVESLGHIRWKRQVDGLSDMYAERGETEEAAKAQDVAYETLSERVVQGSKILDPVLKDVEARRKRYRKE